MVHRQIWVGVDIGKRHHWATAVDSAGAIVWSRQIENVEASICVAIADVVLLASQVRWAVDLPDSPAALLLAVLAEHGQTVVYVPGLVVKRISETYREGKSDFRDSFVIAETIRQRSGFLVLNSGSQLPAELRLLTGYRKSLSQDRTRALARLRDLLTGYFPALESEFRFSARKGAVTLLTGFQSPQSIRDAGVEQLTAWLAEHQVYKPRQIAEVAVGAAERQHTAIPGQEVSGALVAEWAQRIQDIDARITQLNTTITNTFRVHPQAAIIESMPGYGPLLGAELIAVVGDFARFPSAAHLAAYGGLVPIPRDSGERQGNRRRPRRYSRSLLRVFFLSAQCSIRIEGPSRDFYDKKRAEGKVYTQAIIALARRRVDVLWALLRDDRHFQPQMAKADLMSLVTNLTP